MRDNEEEVEAGMEERGGKEEVVDARIAERVEGCVDKLDK